MRIGVVGAGILGLAVARRLTATRPGAHVTVLDKEARVAAHQTGHNSGVAHAGLYYAPGSLKAALCRRGIGLLNKLKAYKLQEEGHDTVEANLALGFKNDQRDYGVGAQILRHLGATKLRLMSNNPRKRAGLLGYGIEIVDTVPIEVPANEYNQFYLQTKRDKLGHEIMK